jgi:hypothetical protein
MRGFTRISNGAPLLFLGVCAVVAVAGVAVGSSLGFSPAPAAVSSTIDEISRADMPNPGVSSYAEHRYRVVGKLRMAVIWAKHDDIGSARMTWRSDPSSSALTLMVGSDPQRAPRSLNKWGYLREEVRSGHAEVFTVRSLGGSESSSATDYVSEGPLFGASCSSIENTDVSGAKTTVSAAGVTYRMFDRLLDRIALAPRWQGKHTTRPEGADAGFLTALQHVIRAGRNDLTSDKAVPITYIYNGTIYDLTIQGSHQLGRTTVGSRTFEQLIRTDVAIQNRTTEEISKFAVTYSPDRAGTPLPIQIFCQPNFWLSVELRLDDTADVPPDPASDISALARIRAICHTAIR